MNDFTFDPLTTPVSWNPIRDLRQTASRARRILGARSVADIREAQSQILVFRQTAFEWEFEAAVDAEKERLRRRALYEDDEEAMRFFELAYVDRDGGHWEFRRGLEEEFEDMPTIDDLTRLESVVEMINVGLPVGVEALDSWTGSEFLAAHALALIEEAEIDLRRVAEPDEDDLKAEQLVAELQDATNSLLRLRGGTSLREASLNESQVRGAFTLAMEALDAVGRAELQQSQSEANELKRLMSGQVRQAQNEASAEREKRKAAAKIALTALHSRTRALREEVLREWDKDRSRFRSAERAGDFFATWLEEERSASYQQRTVRDWIRAHAKKIGVAFR